jgi:hypothetical protein
MSTATRRASIRSRGRAAPRPRHYKFTHQKRAGLGVWCVNRSASDRTAIEVWKSAHPFDRGELERFASAVVGLIRAWSPVLPAGTVLTVPPQGASAPGPYAAEALGRRVAEALGLPFVPGMLRRTDRKRWHGPWHSRTQSDYRCDPPAPGTPMILVADDLATSGTTMRLSLKAIRATGTAAFGFAYSGC